LLDAERGFYGGWGIVAGQLPIATGLALGLVRQGRPQAVLCELGDGAVNMGAWHESLNLAALWQLPVVFLVINNEYGMGTSVERASAEPELWRRADSYRMHGERVDGNDLLAVREAAGRLLARAREDHEPALLETTTYRFRGHSVADAGKVYRSAEELASARERDPIARYAALLREHDLLEDEQLESMRNEVADEVSEAIREAAAAPAPDPDELYENVYGDERRREQFARMDTAAPFGEREETRSWQT